MIAMIHGHSKCVALLLASGADHTIKNSIGETAMSIAQMCGQAEIVALLQEHERYLAQVGSHTKPALREPLQQALQAAEMEESGASVNLLQAEQLQTEQLQAEQLQTNVAREVDDAGTDAEVTESVHQRSDEGPPIQQNQPPAVMDLALTSLDMDLPE
eukprot:m.325078 g.325078  ORF g.325078 m.325078 type:complete len:158 (-) comp55551_c0_seq1:134-607(-)